MYVERNVLAIIGSKWQNNEQKREKQRRNYRTRAHRVFLTAQLAGKSSWPIPSSAIL